VSKLFRFDLEKFEWKILFVQFKHDNGLYFNYDGQEWLDANEPIEAIIDGANIGLYNSMFQGFNFNQVNGRSK
jgi:hypothetical protein